jgi:hypothetical protein
MNPISTLLFGLVFIAIGFSIGVLVSGRRAPSSDETKGDKPAALVRRDSVRLWRDALSQRLMVEMDGKVYRNPGEMDSGQRLRLAPLVGEANAWVPRQAAHPLERAGAAPTLPAGLPASPFQDEKEALIKTAAGQSIAAQIDEILQRKLAGTPLAARGIKLVELPNQGMVVMIGLEKYTDLTQVPEEEVRSVIAQAVAEWETLSSRYIR